MRQLTMTASGALEWWDVDEPRIRHARDALVRPLAVAACDLDSMIVQGRTPLTGPIALGHEFVAEVVEPGEGAAGIGVGDRAAVPFQISCGDCVTCRAGLTSDCESVPPRSMYGFGALGGDWGGALSDLVRVPYADHMLVPLPEGIEPAAAASVSDNMVDAWRTVGPLLEGREGVEVLVVGGGALSIALYAVAFAVALGAARVTYLDQDEQRLALAAELGAEPLEGPPPHHAGRYHVYWEPETPVPVFEMYDRGMTFVTGRPSARTSMPRVLELVAAGTVKPELVTSRVVSFEEAPVALLETHTKLVMVPG